MKLNIFPAKDKERDRNGDNHDPAKNDCKGRWRSRAHSVTVYVCVVQRKKAERSAAFGVPLSNAMLGVTFLFFPNFGTEFLFVDYVPFVPPFGNEIYTIVGFYSKT